MTMQPDLSEPYLFSIGAEFEDDLNKDSISEKLKDKFKTERFSISKNARITKVKNEYLFSWDNVHGYLFSWDNVPGNDSEKLLMFLRDEIDIEWAKSAEIHKSNDGKTIYIVKDENSAEIKIDKKEEKATLKTDDVKNHNLKIKKENGKLNIYVPGNDSERLLRFLKDDFDIRWAETAVIYKSDDGRTISISNDENSAEMTIDEKEEKATLEINNGRTHHLKVKKENGKLNIYKELKIKELSRLVDYKKVKFEHDLDTEKKR